MAVGEAINKLKIFTQSGIEAEREQVLMIRDGIDEIKPLVSPFFAKMTKAEDAYNPVIHWYEGYTYATEGTAQLNHTNGLLTFSGNMCGKAITADTLRSNVFKDQILVRPSDELYVKVTAVDYDNLRVTVAAYGNTGALSSDSGPVAWEFLSVATSDDNEDHQPMATDRIRRECYTQIAELTTKYYHTWKNTKFRNIKNQVADEYRRITEQGALLMARALIRGVPYYTGGNYVGGNQTSKPSVRGVTTWPALTESEVAHVGTYVDAAGVAIGLDDLDSLVLNNYLNEKAQYATGSWVLVFHPIHINHIGDLMISGRRLTRQDKTVGSQVTQYQSKLGPIFDFCVDPHWPKHLLMLVDPADCEYGYYVKDNWWQYELPKNSRTDSKVLTCQFWGTRTRFPRNKATIRNMPTSY